VPQKDARGAELRKKLAQVDAAQGAGGVGGLGTGGTAFAASLRGDRR
jgi:hypothetical protein